MPQGSECHYLEGQGDLVSGLIRWINRVTIWVVVWGLFTYLLSPPDPPSRVRPRFLTFALPQTTDPSVSRTIASHTFTATLRSLKGYS